MEHEATFCCFVSIYVEIHGFVAAHAILNLLILFYFFICKYKYASVVGACLISWIISMFFLRTMHQSLDRQDRTLVLELVELHPVLERTLYMLFNFLVVSQILWTSILFRILHYILRALFWVSNYAVLVKSDQFLI